MSATPITPALLREWPLPEPRGSKYGRGQVLVAGGARATPGAVRLAGEAALRVGAGRLTLAVARSVAGSLAVAVPEAGVRGLAEDDAGDVRGSDAAALAPDLERANAVLVGPGLGEPDGTGALVQGLVPHLPAGVPVVLDAFALGVLPGLNGARAGLAGRLVLTPNLAEVARLLDAADVAEADAVDAAREVARRYGAVVSSHGLVTDGSRTWRVSTGHTGLGTSGSGDVLAGALTGLLARGADRSQAAVWATHLHASAGDSLTASVGKVGFLARELVPELPRLLHELTV
ncbi:NAD(P)H-hydrate dehydratase [Georgenia ruanii]|uniref:ADP-dependent (S)-NAD(P)H-hydrate dehydratase n=1 Tax=Georgenia ruanii TaxID=348442 RepID=A0A7J9UYY2_9MICO|nr:NAD(P)H-hydrate dehydratase [Georgenia ruanii]MPV89847.1 NAD(P)H-hydrate dehydratase [Georgenia ruanii]